MSLTWAELDQLARRSACARITDGLLAMTEQERLAFAPEVEAGIKRTRGEAWWGDGDDPAAGYALAVIACMPSAARAAAPLSRRDMQERWHSVPRRFWQRITDARELTWLPDLGVRLAAKLPVRDVGAAQWQFLAELIGDQVQLAPRTEGFVRGWLNAVYTNYTEWTPFADKLKASPYLDLLLPAVFEIDGMGGELTGGHWTGSGWASTSVFAPAVVQLVAEGRLDRATILAATRDRLIRGDRPAWLRPFTELHDALAPTVDELAGAAGDYAGLLARAPSPIAGMAQRALRSVDEAGRLEFETLLETSGTTLLRTEKGLVKTQLSWLEKVARRQPDRAGEVLETVAVAFGHPALDVQERALTLVGRWIGRLDPATVARLAGASVVLTGDLPARAAELFGTAAPEPEQVETGVPALPAPPAAMPPPITGAAELAAEITALLHTETVVGWERIIAALVALPADGMAATLQPILERYDYELSTVTSYGNFRRPGHLGNAIRRKLAPAAYIIQAHTIKEPHPLTGLLIRRLQEITDRINTEQVAELLATPTRVDGSLDAAVLLDRLIRLETTGREPWPVDFEQALLRVPRTVDADVTVRAAELTSAAGQRFAAWLKDGGLPDPVSSRRVQRNPAHQRAYMSMNQSHRRFVVDLEPAGDRSPLADRILTLDRGPDIQWYSDEFTPDIAIAALPHHREVLAAWALPTLASSADMDQRGAGRSLPAIVECDGPAGPAVRLAVAYVLGARDEADRLAAVDAFLVLAAQGEDLSGVGTEIAELCEVGMLKPSRVLTGLTDAHHAGGSAAVWQVLAAALPKLLVLAPRGLPDLLELATLVAGRAGPRAEVPGLSDVAARTGSSRLVKEARRLSAVLVG
ncbi:DUF6493 family protein [Actinoplanes couchii]|uniref:DUF7824 domain-containing protein n=1 Tax=Actinoplanes couchii TaxID=403638 RepID=A0ABQ3XL75_9ACTN|nr:DUF6493 family protein [Actinoplanes couchii]MDR6319449.1 hypothetical protein [Actinoplanes couchii]GID59160.1 hypothetical protein Aco03nite_075640 [Actinoplanes couchii]